MSKKTLHKDLEKEAFKHKEAEKALWEDKEIYQNIFYKSPVGISIYDESGQCVEANDSIAGFVGATKEEVLQQNYNNIESWKKSGLMDKAKNAIKERSPKRHELLVKSTFGASAMLDCHLIPMASGGLALMVNDISESKQAEVELLHEKHFSEILISQLPGSFYMFQESGRMMRWNENLEKVTGYSSVEIQQMNALDFFVEDEKEKVYQRIKEVFITGESHVEANFLTKDGYKIPHVLSGTKVEYDGVSYLLGVGIDITERKKVEIAQKESEEKFRVIIEESPLGVSLIDINGNYKYLNPRFIEMFGYSLEHIPTGRDWFKKAFPDKEFRHLVLSAWINDKQRYGVGLSRPRTFVVTCHDGSKKTINFKPVTLESGDQLLICEDITETKKLEDQLKQSQKMESIGILAGGVAHDFNNILGIILGNTELAIDDVPEWHPANLNLQKIKTASLRAKDVVNHLLSFARKTNVEKKPINVIPIVKESLKLLRSSIPTSIEIRKNIPQDIDTIQADPTQIHQILINLCSNADHAMLNGGVLVVTLKNVELDKDFVAKYPEMKPGPYVNLTVSDTGHGISQEEIDRIFDPYFTTKEVGKGTGMGLSVVHGIVKEHNGTIMVESELEEGTTFSIFFPVVEKEAVEEIEADMDFPTGNERILFIDDEESIVEIVQQMLERLGYEVAGKTNPVEAFELFKGKPDQFDLVLTDMTMPQMSGIRLSEKLNGVRADIPVIICTGHSPLIDEGSAESLGAAGFIMKPFVMGDIAKTIRTVLDSSKSFTR